jgi:hypothetical protein
MLVGPSVYLILRPSFVQTLLSFACCSCCCSKIAEAEAAVSVNEENWLKQEEQ